MPGNGRPQVVRVNTPNGPVFVVEGTGPLSNEAVDSTGVSPPLQTAGSHATTGGGLPESFSDVPADVSSFMQAGEALQQPANAPRTPLAPPQTAPVAPTSTPTPQRGRRPTAQPVEPSRELSPKEREVLKLQQQDAQQASEFVDPARLPETALEGFNILEEQVPREQQFAQDVSSVQSDAARELEQNADRIVQQIRDNVQRTEEAVESVRQRSDELFNTRFEPRRLFNGASGATRASAYAGIVAGSIISAVRNAVNPGANASNVALRIVNNAIDQDIAAQRENFRRGQLRVQQDSALMQIERELGVERVQALEFLRSSQQQEMALQLESLASAHDGTRVATELRSTANQLRQAAQERALQLQMRMMQLAAQQARRAGRRGATAPSGFDPDSVIRPNPETIRDPIERTRAARAQDAWTSLKPREQNEFAEQLDSSADLIDLLQEMEGIRARGENGIVATPSALARLNTLSNLALNSFRAGSGLGAMDEGLRTFFGEIIGTQGDRFEFTRANATRLRTVLMNQRSQRARTLRRFGFRDRGRSTAQVDTSALMSGATETTQAERDAQ